MASAHWAPGCLWRYAWRRRADEAGTALDLPGLKPHVVAEGFGAKGVLATTAGEVKRALAEAWTHNGPTLIEVPVDPTIPPLV